VVLHAIYQCRSFRIENICATNIDIAIFSSISWNQFRSRVCVGLSLALAQRYPNYANSEGERRKKNSQFPFIRAFFNLLNTKTVMVNRDSDLFSFLPLRMINDGKLIFQFHDKPHKTSP
jgi:hypothetical protein